jgi:hypothetical protein
MKPEGMGTLKKQKQLCNRGWDLLRHCQWRWLLLQAGMLGKRTFLAPRSTDRTLPTYVVAQETTCLRLSEVGA